MADIIDFRGRHGGGDGPEGLSLAPRVAQLEKDVSRNTAILERLEPMIIAIHANYATQADVFAVKADVAAVKSDVARIDGRLDGIPTTWQIISIIAMLLVGIAGIVFTAGRFLRP